jgi:mRNA interferase RelE/StbE
VAYRVEVAPAASREIRRLSKEFQKRIVKKIEALAVDPRPRDAKKLEGMKDLYRVRAGDYRIVYQIHENRSLVVRVRHRSEAYR